MLKGNSWIAKRLRLAEQKRQPDFLTEAELQKVLQHLQRLPYHISLAFRTMLAAGLRVSEVASLKVEDVLRQGDAVVLRVEGKGRKERYAPVTDAAVARELVEFSAQEGPPELFMVTAGALKLYAWKIEQATGVDFHSHRMRHTLVTRLLAQGTPIDVVQKALALKRHGQAHQCLLPRPDVPGGVTEDESR